MLRNAKYVPALGLLLFLFCSCGSKNDPAAGDPAPPAEHEASKPEAILAEYFGFLSAGEIEQPIEFAGPSDVAASPDEMRAYAKDPKREIGKYLDSVEVVESKVDGDYYAGIIRWNDDLGWLHYDFVYLRRDESGDWQVPLWFPSGSYNKIGNGHDLEMKSKGEAANKLAEWGDTADLDWG